jgi:hypothetical protein
MQAGFGRLVLMEAAKKFSQLITAPKKAEVSSPTSLQ